MKSHFDSSRQLRITPYYKGFLRKKRYFKIEEKYYWGWCDKELGYTSFEDAEDDLKKFMTVYRSI